MSQDAIRLHRPHSATHAGAPHTEKVKAAGPFVFGGFKDRDSWMDVLAEEYEKRERAVHVEGLDDPTKIILYQLFFEDLLHSEANAA